MTSSKEILRLLHEGDWACAYGEPERLSNTCHALARVVPAASRLLSRVAQSARSDLQQGRRLWAAAAAELRHPSASRRVH